MRKYFCVWKSEQLRAGAMSKGGAAVFKRGSRDAAGSLQGTTSWLFPASYRTGMLAIANQIARLSASRRRLSLGRYLSTPNSNCHVFVVHRLLLFILTRARCCCASVLCATRRRSLTVDR